MKKIKELSEDQKKLKKVNDAWVSLGNYGKQKFFVQWNESTKDFRCRKWNTQGYITLKFKEAFGIESARAIAQEKIQ